MPKLEEPKLQLLVHFDPVDFFFRELHERHVDFHRSQQFLGRILSLQTQIQSLPTILAGEECTVHELLEQ